jgi:hypothetical protein
MKLLIMRLLDDSNYNMVLETQLSDPNETSRPQAKIC